MLKSPALEVKGRLLMVLIVMTPCHRAFSKIDFLGSNAGRRIMRGSGERSQSGISLFVTAGDCPAGTALPPGEGGAWANCQFRPNRRSANRLQLSNFRARLAAKAHGKWVLGGAGVWQRDLDVARLERSNFVLHWATLHCCGIRCWVKAALLNCCSGSVDGSLVTSAAREYRPPSGFGDQVASQAQRRQTLGRRSRQAARARAKRTAAAGSKADEAMPEAGEIAAAPCKHGTVSG